VRPAAVTEVVEVIPVKVLTPKTLLPPQDNADSKMRMTFEVVSPTPVNCSEHVSVSVHSVAATKGPEIWNNPMLNE
jgi:hypothetical protein